MNALGMHETFVEFVGDGLLHVLIFLKIWWILLRRLGLLPIGWALDRLQAFLLLLWVGSDLLILMRAVVYLKTKTWEEASIVRMWVLGCQLCSSVDSIDGTPCWAQMLAMLQVFETVTTLQLVAHIRATLLCVSGGQYGCNTLWKSWVACMERHMAKGSLTWHPRSWHWLHSTLCTWWRKGSAIECVRW